MQSTTGAPANESTPASGWRKTFFRIVTVITVATLVGLLARAVLGNWSDGTKPAGFLRGAAQGALMPAALPTLLLGKDVAIYSQNNTGIGYKLGYTVGVNGCGAFFFGLLFWRLSRWRGKRGA